MLPHINRLTKMCLYALVYGATDRRLKRGFKRLPARKVAAAVKEARTILNSLS